MLRRTNIKFVNETIKKNPSWKVLDVGCGFTANENATVIADVKDFSNFYKNRNFIKITNNKLPFKDKEFDFVISSHVIEHVLDFEFFIKELERISSNGYIELPTRLGDNFIFENVKDHIWWFTYDDINNQLVAAKRNQLIDPFVTVSTGQELQKMFRESLVLEILWENKISYRIDNNIRNENLKRISFYKFIRKFFSKKFRTLTRFWKS